MIKVFSDFLLRVDAAKAVKRAIDRGEDPVEAIWNLKAANAVRPVVAYWQGYWDCECSYCGKSNECRTPYCPNCGAKMDNKPLPF